MMPQDSDAQLRAIFVGLARAADEDNAALRARCQAADSALRQLLDAAEDALPMVSLIDDAACLRLLEVVRAVNQGLPEPPRASLARQRLAAPPRGTPICTRCHRLLVVPQELDHIATDTGWVCMPCWASQPYSGVS